MRSSIACVRCRRSKVKCVNNGVGTTCRACENSGRDCQYPSPMTSGSRRRDSVSARPDGNSLGPPAGGSGGGDGERRQRPRKSMHSFAANSGMRESPRPHLDALDSALLTPEVWHDLFDIFEVHYSADLPFLHKASFLKPLRAGNGPRAANAPDFGSEMKPVIAQPRPPASDEFLLAFLALTARFHPKLVAHHSPPTASRSSNPLIASEYYASAANQRLSSIFTENRKHDIEFTQACLMLGLHDWGMCRGGKAWVLVGMAIRSAQAMGLQYELDLDDEPLSRSLALTAEVDHPSHHPSRKSSVDRSKSRDDQFIEQEIRRRTFWSCFIMDRYLSSGKYRPQMLQAKELRIQLPASENSFAFAEKVRTLLLGEENKTFHGTGRAEVRSYRQHILGTTGPSERNLPSPAENVEMPDADDDKGRLETGKDEGLVSRYIKILEIYGKVIKWSCAGGRRTEKYPPWDSRCDFYQLNRDCLDFQASLPRQQTLSHKNTQAHISMKTSTPYTLVHVVYLLCQIMLHREYVPFIALRCSKPSGPLDAPLFPPEEYNVPPGFWEDSARSCFKSAREIMNLVRTSQEWNTLVETPIVGFAIYIVAFIGNYCISFPWMDPDGYMCTPVSTAKNPNSTPPGESEGFLAARKALELIGLMRPKLYMASGWFRTIEGAYKYYSKIKKDYNRNIRNMENGSSDGDSPESARHLSLRNGGAGGGLDEYKSFERALQDFGNLEDQDVEMADINIDSNRRLDALYDESSGENTVKSEDGEPKAEPPLPPPPPPPPPPPKTDNGSWSAINTTPGEQSTRLQSISTPSSGQFRSYDSFPLLHPPHLPSTQSHQSTTPYNYSHTLSNFRPASHAPDGSAPEGAPPSLTSPTSRSATTPSQHSPSFERSSTYGSWASPYGVQNNPQQQLPPPPYPNGFGTAHHPGGGASSTRPPSAASPTSGYPTSHHSPTSHHHHQQSHDYSTQLPPLQTLPPAAAAAATVAAPPPATSAWDTTMKEAWLNNMDTRFGADDFAAFANGGEFAEWAGMAAATQGFTDGWLSALWSGASERGVGHHNGNGNGNGNGGGNQQFSAGPQRHHH